MSTEVRLTNQIESIKYIVISPPCRTWNGFTAKMSSYKIGVNLRVTENSNQGGRKYMEDTHAIRFVKNDEGGFEFAYFGIFDGHGGGEASKFAREHLLDEITKYECFWNDNDEDVLHAIKSGFLDVHFAMWREVGEFKSGII